jgi:hypothetical protein
MAGVRRFSDGVGMCVMAGVDALVHASSGKDVLATCKVCMFVCICVYVCEVNMYVFMYVCMYMSACL